ncbi:MAG: alpha/beta hydrolase [Ilumatobacteraceae bacterium]
MSFIRGRVLLAAFVITSLLAGSLSTAATVSASEPEARLAWSSCYADFGTFECAMLRVPLDYDRPNGSKISVAMVRLPAANPELRQGSIFLNPGGPGGSGVEFAVFAGPALFTQDVRDRFDLVGFDPRGISRSDQLRCFNSPDEWGPYFTSFTFPSTRAELRQWIASDRFLDRACARKGGPIMNHMSTANVARDLDRMRAAVGDEKLTYAGYSYGTQLGQTYANMFPDHFRAIVIDGVLDPIAWTTGARGESKLPFSTRLRSDVGAMDSLNEFLRLCDAGGDACAFSGEAAERYANLAEKLRESPLLLTDPETGEAFEYNYSILIGDTLGAMYSSFSWPDFAGFLAFLEAADAPDADYALSTFRNVAGLSSAPFPEFPEYQNFIEGFPGVACSDSDNPHSYEAWWKAGIRSDEQFGYFGKIWTWASSICAHWPGSDRDRYTGPWTHSTEAPVLVVGTLHDPATRYQGAQTAASLLPNSTLLTVNGWAHTSLFLSACADAAIATYLIEAKTPPPGTVCNQDLVPFVDFPVPAAAAPSARAGQDVQVLARAQLIPEWLTGH